MEIGGFITEGAEIVNHDSSLSGNGTVDSPLGVVPGYNETVLWSGTANVGTVMELSEPMANFEKVRLENAYGQVYYHSLGSNGGWWNPMTPTFFYGGNSSGTTVEIIMDRVTFTTTATDTLTFNSNIDIKVTTAGSLSVTNNVNNNTQRITKVVGINRLSAIN